MSTCSPARSACLRLLLPVCVLAAASATEPPADEAPLAVDAGTRVPGVWQPAQRLYVKGNLGVSSAQLSGLERWLDTHATNWVVVLLESAAGERYTDAEGRTFTGIEAVNHALGKGLVGGTAFGQSVDARTGERNACFFALFLKDRRFSYFGSDAQDRRGLGEDEWVGNLDAPAIAAMRNGGRVVDAVRDTIRNIEDRLTARLEADAREQARQAAEAEANRARARAMAEAALASASNIVQRLEEHTATFNRLHPGMTGDLATPDLPHFRARVDDTRRTLLEGDATAASRLATAVVEAVTPILSAQDQHAADAPRLEELGGRYQQLSQHPRSAAVQKQLEVAAERLQQARRDHARGDSAYTGYLAAAAEALQSAGRGLQFAERAARAAQITTAAAAGGSLALLGLVGVLLNRRRLASKLDAEGLFRQLQTALREKTNALFALLDRRATVVGSSSAEAARRYAGATLELSRQAIRDVDELFIMSACVDRVLADARAILRPVRVGPQLLNLFRRAPYRRVLRLLRDEPIAFRPDEGLELIVRGERTERDRLLGDVHAYQPFAMTFEGLIAAFNERAARALAAFDRIEQAAPEVTRVLETAQQAVAQMTTLLPELDRESAEDGLLRLDDAATRLLPAANEALATLLQQAANDPVGALDQSAPRATRLTGEGAALARLTTTARRERLPALARLATSLREGGVDAAWIGSALDRLAGEGEALARLALDESITPTIESLGEAWQALETRAARAVELDQRRRGPAREDLAATQRRIDAGRAEIGAALGLDPEVTLRETDTDPSAILAQATAAWNELLTTLERGDVPAAAAALEAATAHCAAARDIVEASRKHLAERDGVVASLKADLEALERRLPEHRQILAALQTAYAPDVLRLGAGDPAHPQANGTIADNLTEAEAAVAGARAQVDAAEAAFARAGLLEAADLWSQARAAHDVAVVRLLEITEKRDRVQAAVVANRARLADLEQRAQAAAPLAAAPTTMAPTRDLLEAAQARLAALRGPVASGGDDPFTLASDLERLAAAFEAGADQARCDRDVFDEAQRSARAALAQQSQALVAATEIRQSPVPPSATARAALDELPSLATALRSVETALTRAHENWNTLDAEADRLHTVAGRITATLRGEIDRANRALATLTSAAEAVRRAGGWTGGYGVRIDGAPGSDALADARGWLERGEYERARSLADSARRVAETAVAAAVAEVMRRQAAEEARREAERRRRQREEAARQIARAARWAGGGNRPGGSGFGGRSSWGSSGSGARTSGFRSGSGARTSGW